MKNLESMSVTKKLLMSVIVTLLLFTLLDVVVQALFFERIYVYSKCDVLKKQVEHFSAEYVKITDEDQINRALTSYSENGSYMLIISGNGDIKYSTSYMLEIEADDGSHRTFFLDHVIRSDMYEKLDLSEGDLIDVAFVARSLDESNVIYIPFEIRNGDKRAVFFDANRQLGKGRHFEQMQITGTVLSAPTAEAARKMVNRDDSISAAMDWIQRVNEGERPGTDRPIHYIYTSPQTGDTYAAAVKQLGGSEGEMIFAVTTLRPVREAVGVMRVIQLIWLGAISVVVIFVSIMVVKKITRPIVEISLVTERVKELDFSRRCTVGPLDEIGRLAQNVNAMSDALDNAIQSLTLANEKLTDDIESERRMEKKRREFVAAVSHELKTPLAVIRAYSEGIMDGVSGEKKEHYLNTIVEETKRMDALVLDMLDVSKLEAGAEKPDKKRHSLSAAARGAADRFAADCERLGISLTCETEGDVYAEFDSRRIDQVITNFISNAVKNTPSGGSIRVSVCENEGAARLTVENDGAGIPEDEIGSIWDKFYRVDKSRTRSPEGGTGLGLSIAKNILMLHGAEYFVKNTENGVMFEFELPNSGIQK